MPKIIQTICDFSPEEGVLVRGSYLQNNSKSSNLLAEARRRAKILVAAAQIEAQQLRQQAQSEGYAEGIIQVAGELIAYLSRHTALAASMQACLEEKMRTLLLGCVNNPEVVIGLFEESILQENLKNKLDVNFVLPESFRSSHRSLVARLRPYFDGDIHIEYHQEIRFVLRLGEHVSEFSPDDFVSLASSRLMSELPAAYMQSHAIKEECRLRLAQIFESGSLTPYSTREGIENHDPTN
ncbi:hypothetical protein [Glaciimonas immobilis]|uniref:Oxygen-regulated invasion protein OrgB n=1 Tax=Glaciimonas immobilis TaxID=728004 RepID=A0A840RM46_9BURK|nr:hypothetical protein [Glaciimonas immobilis]KAF3999349.1 hypothetical protein HAV38_05315 [Glaciimonas immobilis]MBB5198833.1 hypothetical protein [Glaciimonas immobilis]